MATIEFTLLHPSSDESVTAEFDDEGTPDQVIEQVQEQSWLKPSKDGVYCLVKEKDNEQLTGDASLRSQGVVSGMRLKVRLRANGGADSAPPRPRRSGPPRSRLELDYRSLVSISGKGCVARVVPYADSAGRDEIRSEADAHRLRSYRVDYKLPMPTCKSGMGENWSFHFDLGPVWERYPGNEVFPVVTSVGPQPWHYRLYHNGVLCTRSPGHLRYVAGQHVGIVAALLNADEPFERPHDHGYRPDCYAFYRSHFNGPITRGLVIPEVPESVFLISDPPKQEVGLKVIRRAAEPATTRLRLVGSPVPSGTKPRLVLALGT